MQEWLYSIIQSATNSPSRPDFAQRSALNWMRALRWELEQEHGAEATAQYQSCQLLTKGVKGAQSLDGAAVFEPLFASVSFATSLMTSALRHDSRAWECPGNIVQWYYAVYNAARAMIAATNSATPDTHAGTASSLNGTVQKVLPHPFNMRADWMRAEEYAAHLPTYPSARLRGGTPGPLAEVFQNTRDHAREMLLAYLNGTARYTVWQVKQDLVNRGDLKKHGLTTFRQRAAVMLRDQRLRKRTPLNFLHLAFRYRGKSNYRDHIFLAYGRGQLNETESKRFVTDLAAVARFMVVFGLTYVERRAGTLLYSEFKSDLATNFRGANDYGRSFLPPNTSSLDNSPSILGKRRDS